MRFPAAENASSRSNLTDIGSRSLVIWWDVAAAALLALLAFLSVAGGFGPGRLVAGMSVMLLAPGYAAALALFPDRRDLNLASRVVLSVGLTLAMVPFTAFFLSFTPLHIRPIPLAGLLMLQTWFLAGIGLYRRVHLPPDEAYIWRPAPMFGDMSRGRVAVIAATAVFVAVSMGVALAFSGSPVRYTTFYLLAPDGTISGLQERAEPDETLSVLLRIENHEGEDVSYALRASLDGEPQVVTTVEVLRGATGETQLSLTPTRAGNDQRVDIELFRGDSPTPYRALHFLLDVKSRGR